MKKRPISIENRWDILYRDYPEIYDEFANVPYEPKMIDILHEKFDFSKKKVVDIGSGSGRSTIEIAKYAEYVIGVEPEKSMRSIAKKNTADKNLENVFYIEGKAEKIPLDDYSADMVIAITAPLFVEESKRVTKPGGTIISVGVAPGWYGGELSSVFDIQDEHAVNEELQNVHRLFVENNGFSFFDINSTSYYGSLEKIINTYGFIFGKKMIRHLKQNNITSIKWKFRVHYIQN
jgi:ubiquinone/menaquinone biosynthesis C-methylase UbiE